MKTKNEELILSGVHSNREKEEYSPIELGLNQETWTQCLRKIFLYVIQNAPLNKEEKSQVHFTRPPPILNYCLYLLVLPTETACSVRLFCASRNANIAHLS